MYVTDPVSQEHRPGGGGAQAWDGFDFDALLESCTARKDSQRLWLDGTVVLLVVRLSIHFKGRNLGGRDTLGLNFSQSWYPNSNFGARVGCQYSKRL